MNHTRDRLRKSPAQIAAEARFFEAIVGCTANSEKATIRRPATPARLDILKRWMGPYHVLRNFVARPVR